jgi:hypothetical protein
MIPDCRGQFISTSKHVSPGANYAFTPRIRIILWFYSLVSQAYIDLGWSAAHESPRVKEGPDAGGPPSDRGIRGPDCGYASRNRSPGAMRLRRRVASNTQPGQVWCSRAGSVQMLCENVVPVGRADLSPNVPKSPVFYLPSCPTTPSPMSCALRSSNLSSF